MRLKANLIILGSLAAVALGLLAALLALKGQGTPAATSSPQGDDTSVLVYQTRGAVSQLKITTGQSGFYTLSGLSFEADMAEQAALSDYDGQLVNQSRIAGVLNGSRSLYALKLVAQSPEDYRLFGLEEPRATVEVTDNTGYSVTLLIGDPSPGNEGVYLKRQDSTEIYLVPAYSVENYLLSEVSYLNLSITPGSSAQGFDTLVLGGTVREAQGQVSIRREGDAYVLTAPVKRPLEETMAPSILGSLLGLSADSVAAVNPTRDDLKAVGLDTPYATAQVSGSWGEFFLSVSAPDGGGMVYLHREGVPLLYTIQADRLPWLELSYTELMDSFAYTPDIDRLAEVQVQVAEAAYDFRLTHGEGSVLAVSFNNISLDVENFQRFYISLISARLVEHTDQSPLPDEHPLLTITYTNSDGTSQPVEFYAGPSRRHLIRVGNERFFLTPSSYLDRLMQDLEKVTTGQRVESYEW